MNQKSPAIVSAQTVEEVARHTVRWTSLGVLFLSFVGAVMAFNGRWPNGWRFWEDISPLALAAGIMLQSFCTLMEWGNRRQRWSMQYLGPLTLDVISTYIGFAPVLIPIFERGLSRATLPAAGALAAAHLAVIALSLWASIYPEQNLVEERHA